MPIQSFLDISTKYITQKDSVLLAELMETTAFGKGTLPRDDDSIFPRVIGHEYGFIIHIDSDEEHFDDHMVSMKSMRFSEAMIAIMRHALANKCWLVYLDRDGGDLDGFPTFDW